MMSSRRHLQRLLHPLRLPQRMVLLAQLAQLAQLAHRHQPLSICSCSTAGWLVRSHSRIGSLQHQLGLLEQSCYRSHHKRRYSLSYGQHPRHPRRRPERRCSRWCSIRWFRKLAACRSTVVASSENSRRPTEPERRTSGRSLYGLCSRPELGPGPGRIATRSLPPGPEPVLTVSTVSAMSTMTMSILRSEPGPGPGKSVPRILLPGPELPGTETGTIGTSIRRSELEPGRLAPQIQHLGLEQPVTTGFAMSTMTMSILHPESEPGPGKIEPRIQHLGLEQLETTGWFAMSTMTSSLRSEPELGKRVPQNLHLDLGLPPGMIGFGPHSCTGLGWARLPGPRHWTGSRPWCPPRWWLLWRGNHSRRRCTLLCARGRRHR
jgi:hypothetical protein